MFSDPSKQTKPELIEEVIAAHRAEQSAVDAFDAAAADHLGVNATDLRVMDILTQHEPLTPGELAERTRLTSGAVTAVLDRMEEAGYVRRRHDTADRRRVLVEVSPLAWQRCEEIWGPMAADGQRLMSGYTREELLLILDYLRKGTELNRRHLDRVASPPSRRRVRGVTRAGRRRHAARD